MSDTNVVPIPEPEPKKLPAAVEPFDFMPRTLSEAMELARMLSESTMVPRDYIGKPGNVFVAMQHGAELGLKPVQALQSIAVINGKPGIYGDAGKALLIKHGCTIVEFDGRETEAKGYAQCTVGRANKPAVTRTFSIEDAKRARLWGKDGPWTQYPFRQMGWRAFWFAARDQAPDILKGLPPAEELRDMEIDVTPAGSHTFGDQATGKEQSATEKLKEKIVASPKAQAFIDAFDKATTTVQVLEIVEKVKAANLKGLDHAKVGAAYRALLARVTPEAKEEPPKEEPPKEEPPKEEEPAIPALSDQQLIDRLAKATTRDELDQICADYINQTKDGPRKNALLAIYHKRIEDLS